MVAVAVAVSALESAMVVSRGGVPYNGASDILDRRFLLEGRGCVSEVTSRLLVCLPRLTSQPLNNF